MNKQKESHYLSLIRAIALLLIVTKHTIEIPKDAPYFSALLRNLLDYFSSFGVFIYFVLGGYLFYYNIDTIKTYLLKKSRTLMIPWIFCGIVLYGYFTIRHGVLAVNLFQYIMGIGNHLWYMTSFFIIIMSFKLLTKIRYGELILVLCGIALLFPDCFSFCTQGNYFYQWYFAGAWPIAVVIGYLINKYELQTRLYLITRKYGMLLSIPILLACIAVTFLNIGMQYWSGIYLICSLLSIPFIIWMSLLLDKVLGSTMIEIARYSLVSRFICGTFQWQVH